MNNRICSWLIIFLIFIASISLIIIPGIGLWVVYQPGDMCLGKMSIGVLYVAAGFFIIMFIIGGLCVCCCNSCNSDCGEAAIVASCSGLFLFVSIIVMAIYALTRRTIGFPALEKEITSTESWMDIKHCLYQQTRVCAEFQRKFAHDTTDQFFARRLTLIESGCCKPPKECNFNFSSPTVWMEPGNGTGSYSNTDCYKWDNDPKKLCYNCQVCKYGIAQAVKKTWITSGVIVLIAWLILASVMTLIAVLSRVEDHYYELL